MSFRIILIQSCIIQLLLEFIYKLVWSCSMIFCLFNCFVGEPWRSFHKFVFAYLLIICKFFLRWYTCNYFKGLTYKHLYTPLKVSIFTLQLSSFVLHSSCQFYCSVQKLNAWRLLLVFVDNLHWSLCLPLGISELALKSRYLFLCSKLIERDTLW